MMSSLRLNSPLRVWSRFYLLLVLITGISSAAAAQKRSLSIYFPSGFPGEVRADVVRLLEEGTDLNWKIAPEPGAVTAGFVLQQEQQSGFKTREGYRLKSNGSSLLTITSGSEQGLVFGLYRHLRRLGYRFYLPDDLYTEIPEVRNPFGSGTDVVEHPFVPVRNFFGTGGFGTANADPDKSVEKDWNLWKLRNGFGSAHALAGHRGETFILENKEQLKKHPEWLATPMKDVRKDITIKLNYRNPEALEYYINWSLKRFTKPGYTPPPRNFSDFVSMEPSDGGGFAEEEPGDATSISDQVYGAANEAGRKLDRLFPDNPNIGVNLYAYSTHAEPPSFPLHPRVFVSLVPYQFQKVAYGPSFIRLWAEKAQRFGIYDYLKYTDAHYDLPGGMSLQENMLRLLSSIRMGSEGTTYETSYSKFSTGIPLWVIGRYLADGDSDWEKNLAQLTRDLYKKASESVGSLFSLFYNEPAFSSRHMANAVRLLERAEAAANDRKVERRLSELKQYLVFAHLVYDSRRADGTPLKDRLVPVARYARQMYEQKIVHSYRIMSLVSFRFLNVNKKEPDYDQYRPLYQAWAPETKPAAAAWSTLPTRVTEEEAEKDFARLPALYRNPVRSGTTDLKTVLGEVGKDYKPKKEFVIGGNATARGSFSLSSEKATRVRLRYRLSGNAAAPKVTISGIDKAYTTPLLATTKGKEGELDIRVPAGETTLFLTATPQTIYQMEVRIDEGIVFFDGSPRGIISFYKNLGDPVSKYTYDPAYYPSYIFFPEGISEISFKVKANGLSLVGPDGKTVATERSGNEADGMEHRNVRVPERMSGKFWKTVLSGNYNYSFTTIPDRYFLLEPR